MNTKDIFEIIIAIITIIIAIIGLFQAEKADKKAEKANDIAKESNNKADESNNIAKKSNDKADKANNIAEKALHDSQKDYMPFIRFTGEYDIVLKSIKTLRNENTFDFDQTTVLLYDSVDDKYYDEDDELYCISAEIENCGKGIVTGITLESLWVQSGNKVAMEDRAPGELDMLCYIKSECTEWFVLSPGEKTKVNFIVANSIIDGINYTDMKEANNRMLEFKQNNENIMIGMDLKIKSVNDTVYCQNFLAGTFLDGSIVHNSFIDVKKRDK